VTGVHGQEPLPLLDFTTEIEDKSSSEFYFVAEEMRCFIH
jgi:hypothetical protein